MINLNDCSYFTIWNGTERRKKGRKKEKPEWEWPFFGSIYGVMCHRTPKQKKRKITEFTRRTKKESEAG
jgi:hypothetical protein